MNLNLTEQNIDKAFCGILERIPQSDYKGVKNNMAQIDYIEDQEIIYQFHVSLKNSNIHVNIPNEGKSLTYECNVDEFIKEARTFNIDEDAIIELVHCVVTIYFELRKTTNG